MTELEKAKLMASLIGHNERMMGLESVPQISAYTEAMRQALACMIQVHGLENEPLLREIERGTWLMHPDSAMILLRGLRGYHNVGLMHRLNVDGWPDGEDCYLEAIEEAIRCLDAVYLNVLSVHGDQ